MNRPRLHRLRYLTPELILRESGLTRRPGHSVQGRARKWADCENRGIHHHLLAFARQNWAAAPNGYAGPGSIGYNQ